MGSRVGALAIAALVGASLAGALAVASGSGRSASEEVRHRAEHERETHRASGPIPRLAYRLVRAQVRLGPRPAGSPASHRLKRLFRGILPRGRIHPVPGHPGLHNVVGVVPGREPSRFVVIGAHHDTKDLPGVVGANDGASGVAVVAALARSIGPRSIAPTLVFILFDGEESPRGVPDSEFLRHGLRGSKAAARRFRDAESMVLLDMVGRRRSRFRRELFSDRELWAALRRAAVEVGAARAFPSGVQLGVLDDHIPFRRLGVPAINIIDFGDPCWHRRCDRLDRISPRALDTVARTVRRLLFEL